jgi:hypothetical protein
MIPVLQCNTGHKNTLLVNNLNNLGIKTSAHHLHGDSGGGKRCNTVTDMRPTGFVLKKWPTLFTRNSLHRSQIYRHQSTKYGTWMQALVCCLGDRKKVPSISGYLSREEIQSNLKIIKFHARTIVGKPRCLYHGRPPRKLTYHGLLRPVYTIFRDNTGLICTRKKKFCFKIAYLSKMFMRLLHNTQGTLKEYNNYRTSY